MKEIKLSGREMAVLRAIENMGSTGEEIAARTNIAPDDLTDLLNGLSEVGYVEIFTATGTPVLDTFAVDQLNSLRFETNPSYTQELKKAMLRH